MLIKLSNFVVVLAASNAALLPKTAVQVVCILYALNNTFYYSYNVMFHNVFNVQLRDGFSVSNVEKLYGLVNKVI